ncbi:NAD(P)-dependent oxidoreductase [Pseudoalteromonas rubra]|uniref:NAD(P)-dependent oxidoreductase n=1 Tax=Pseudoalteromonas rubra TaxID=43658 RepID=A0A5S3WP32_9GAMM|nr:SDR family oxidoreductase [Pseudoalteromonas rubra]TMP29521.1 NAD(P)-dependent oxidoreductase [Pseudoalteromonas rubra]TMP35115.1 NAD(P)-dependent oxidoreductase [Pseudoalteromonas rubra]
MKKVVLITGASRGIGAATANLLAEQGYLVAVNYKSNHLAAEQVVAQIHAQGGIAHSFAADISEEAQVVKLCADIKAQLGPISHLVNNAGVLASQMRVEDMTAERINQMLCTNVTPYFICAREVLKQIRAYHQMDRCAIVNVSSAASYLGGANEYVDYAAAKGAIDSFTRGLSLELAAEGIRVNCVRPGCIYTDIHADGGEPGRVDRLASLLPLQRGGKPEEVASAIAWLLSEQASYATGTFIDLAGGK